MASSIPHLPPDNNGQSKWRLPRILSLAAAAVAAAVSGVLVGQYFTGTSLPGCGINSACAALTSGRWGAVAGWPVSFFGLAYFCAIMCGLVAGGHSLPPLWKWIVRVGAMVSVFFVVVMLVERHYCIYCLAAHCANGVLWLAVERTKSEPSERGWLALSGVGTTFCMTMLLLGGGRYFQLRQQSAQAARALNDSTSRIVENAKLSERLVQSAPDEGLGQIQPSTFLGRFRLGPEVASLRLVAWVDYQCDFCRSIEREIQAVLANYDSVSFSVRHFPLCSDCNHAAPGRVHPQACRAAQAAKAAGLLDGNEGFWRMHDWLVAHGEDFTDTRLSAALPALGFSNTQDFFATMESDQVDERLQADIADAEALGVERTPFVFVNGVELRGLATVEAFREAVVKLIEQQLPARSGEADKPMGGEEKFFEMWASSILVPMPPSTDNWSIGPDSAEVRIDLFADHASARSADASRLLRGAAAKNPNVRLIFWHFPLSRRFNRNLDPGAMEDFPHSHEMSIAAEAAGRLAGAEGFWRMHEWLLNHQEDFQRSLLSGACQELDLNYAELATEMEAAAVAMKIGDQVEKAALIGMRTAPHIVINGKLVSGWHTHPGVIERIIQSLK